MALYLTESDVLKLLPMDAALARVEASFVAQHRGEGTNQPRRRIFLPNLSLHYMAAALPGEGFLGMKIYTITAQAWRFVVLLFDATSGELAAFIEADQLGRIRTGAASGVATKYLARQDASQVGLIGTGRQARTQLEAVARARKLSAVRVFGRDETRRRQFAREMSERLGVAVEPASSAEGAACGAEIVVTATTAREPVLRGEWLAPGAHVNAIGANMANRRELDDAVFKLAAPITVDSAEQAREEAGDLIHGLAAAGKRWEDVVELHQIVGGGHPGRRSAEEISLFKSCGIALWDVAVAAYVYRRAAETGTGRPFKPGAGQVFEPRREV
jgi:ornithine cyclodeaminase/alanine dehydrogenase